MDVAFQRQRLNQQSKDNQRHRKNAIVIAHTVKSGKNDGLPSVDQIAGGEGFTDSGRWSIFLDGYMCSSMKQKLTATKNKKPKAKGYLLQVVSSNQVSSKVPISQ